MNALLPSGFLKTALALSLTFWAGRETLAQGTNARAGQAFAAAFSGHGGQAHKINALVSRPGNSQDFSANGPGVWQHQTNSAYTYDAQGRLTQRLYTHPVTGQNMARETRVYNVQGDETEFRLEQWQGAAWETMDGSRSQITYNGSGQKLETKVQFWNNSASTWQNDYREDIIYGANGLASTITNSSWNNNSWVPEDRMNLSYSLATGTTAIIQEYVGGSWQDLYRATNLVWRVPFEIPASYILEIWNGNGWVLDEKYTSVYDANGGHVGVYEEWDGMAWVNKYRDTETYDANKNYTGWKEESWNAATSTWDYDGEERELLTYSGIDVTQRIFQDSWNMTGTLQDYGKEVYNNFQTFNISGVKELAELAVNVYPNPARETLSISFPEHKGNFSATLTDLTGKTCLTRTFQAGEVISLNLANLPAGIYLLQLQTETSAAVKRIVKQ